MKRSFGGGSDGGRRGGMLRTVQRAVRSGGGVGGGATQEPFSHSTTPRSSSSTNYKPTTSNPLSLSSSTLFNLPIHATTSTRASSCSSPDEFDEWEFIDGISNDHDDESAPLSLGVYYDDHFVVGSVPSQDEVQHALSSLHQVLDPASFSQFMKDRAADDSDKDVAEQTTSPTGYLGRVPSVGLEADWMEPSMQLCNSGMLTSCRSDRVYDAFHLLQTEPSVQRMVLSLSSDKAVWDAVLDNEVVRELRESLDEADNNVDVSSISDDGSDDSEAALEVLSWIFINTKAKVMDLIDKITKMMDELFLPPQIEKKAEKAADSFVENVKTSFLLSVVVFLIVVVIRASKA